MADTDNFKKEATKLAVDALYSEKGHFKAAEPWRNVHLWLGVPAVLFAFGAGTGFVTDQLGDGVATAFAFISGSLSAIATFLNPDEKARSHHASGVEYAGLRRRLRQFIDIRCEANSSDINALSEDLKFLTDDINTIQANARPIPQKAHQKAKLEIEQPNGTASYSQSDKKSI